MDELFILAGIGFSLYLLIGPALGIWALFALRRERAGNNALRSTVEGALRRIERLERPAGATPAAETPIPAPPPEAAAPPPPETPADKAAADDSFWPRPAAAPVSAGREAPKAQIPGARQRSWAGLEESLTSRWLVWLGAVTLALAGLFLVKYSIDRGWFGPTVRIVLGYLLAVILTAAGEWLRRRPLQRAMAALRPDHVPPALSGAGLFTAFASTYAAYGLYGLIGPLPAFALLALIAFGAVALSLLQGPTIAALGLLGGFATPALVATTDPSAWALFPYLMALVLASLALVRWQNWWWLAWGTLAGALAWPLLWIMSAWHPGDAPALAIYLVLLAAAFLLVRPGRDDSLELVTLRRGLGGLATADRVAWAAALGITLLCFVLVRVDGYEAPSLMAWGLLTLLFLLLGAREAVFDALCLPTAALGLALVATRHVPRIISNREPFFVIDGQVHGYVAAPLLPPEIQPFVLTALAVGAAIGIGGFLALWSARRPALWAGVSSAVPVLLLVIAYWRLTGFETDLGWAIAALLLAAVLVGAAHGVARARERRGFDTVLGIYAAGVTSALALAATMTLEQAWLTVALSAQVLALAWIYQRIPVRPLRLVALAVAAVVLVRLMLNPFVLAYSLGPVPGLSWILYGYGLPAAAFWLAARQFRQGGDDLLVKLLDAGTIGLVTLLVTFEIRSLVAGSLDSRDYALLERALHALAWGALGFGLLVQFRKRGGAVLNWGWRVLGGLSAAHVLLLQVLIGNPLWSGESVGAWPLFNSLTLAYLAPAALALAYARELQSIGAGRLALGAALAALVLAMLFITLEVRHAFHGQVLSHGTVGDGELYAYSAAWIGFALALLGIGVFWRYALLRQVSLAVLLVTVAKVFLIDMAALTGLWRVASFLGLGLGLVAIALFYRRFVFPPTAPAATRSGA